jgi:hypothetical protein
MGIWDAPRLLYHQFPTAREALTEGRRVATRFNVFTVVVGTAVYLVEPPAESRWFEAFKAAWEHSEKRWGQWNEQEVEDSTNWNDPVYAWEKAKKAEYSMNGDEYYSRTLMDLSWNDLPYPKRED